MSKENIYTILNTLKKVEEGQFANPKQKPGDQVRGKERASAYKKKGKHPFLDRLVGESTIGEDLVAKMAQQFADFLKQKEEPVIEDWGTSDMSAAIDAMDKHIQQFGMGISPESIEDAARSAAEFYHEYMGLRYEDAVSQLIGAWMNRKGFSKLLAPAGASRVSESLSDVIKKTAAQHGIPVQDVKMKRVKAKDMKGLPVVFKPGDLVTVTKKVGGHQTGPFRHGPWFQPGDKFKVVRIDGGHAWVTTPSGERIGVQIPITSLKHTDMNSVSETQLGGNTGNATNAAPSNSMLDPKNAAAFKTQATKLSSTLGVPSDKLAKDLGALSQGKNPNDPKGVGALASGLANAMQDPAMGAKLNQVFQQQKAKFGNQMLTQDINENDDSSKIQSILSQADVGYEGEDWFVDEDGNIAANSTKVAGKILRSLNQSGQFTNQAVVLQRSGDSIVIGFDPLQDSEIVMSDEIGPEDDPVEVEVKTDGSGKFYLYVNGKRSIRTFDKLNHVKRHINALDLQLKTYANAGAAVDQLDKE